MLAHSSGFFRFPGNKRGRGSIDMPLSIEPRPPFVPEARGPSKLAVACLMANVPVPLPSLRKMCQTVVELYGTESRLVGARDGRPVYEVKMTAQVGRLWYD